MGPRLFTGRAKRPQTEKRGLRYAMSPSVCPGQVERLNLSEEGHPNVYRLGQSYSYLINVPNGPHDPPGLWYPAQLVYDESTMSVASPVYFEIVDFIAAGTTPEAVIDFRPSSEAQQRVAALIERRKADALSPEDEAELDHFMELEHILRMAKARARQILSRGE